MIYYAINIKKMLYITVDIIVVFISLCTMCITYIYLPKSLNRKFIIVNQ